MTFLYVSGNLVRTPSLFTLFFMKMDIKILFRCYQKLARSLHFEIGQRN